jgi:hypothetical protein
VAKRWRTGPPDFVGVGAQRCGTTWWFRMLIRHKRVRPPRRLDDAEFRKKELHFFDRFDARPMTDTDVAGYHHLFPRPRESVAGEWTPGYMESFATPRLLHRAAPEARLLVLLRDPIERFRSGVMHRMSRGGPDRSFQTAAVDAIGRSRYARQLERLLEFYPAERILVLQYERCRADPHGEWLRTLRFLGIDDDQEPPEFEQARGTTMAPRKIEPWPDLLEALHTTLDPDVERLCTLVPDLDLGLWKNFSHLAAAAPPAAR